MVRPFVVVALAAAWMVTAFVPGARAIDVRNEDARAYKLVVKSTQMRRTMNVPARSLSIVICPRTCTFVVPGVGRVRASGQDDVIIRDGRVVRHKVPKKKKKKKNKRK